MTDLTRSLAARLTQIPGVRAVTLGGSRARGAAPPDSDIDLGLYYRAETPFDLAALNALCRELDDAGTASKPPHRAAGDPGWTAARG